MNKYTSNDMKSVGFRRWNASYSVECWFQKMEYLIFFSHGELIRLLQAEQIGRALEPICYRAALLEITKVSSHETARILAKATLQDYIDRL